MQYYSHYIWESGSEEKENPISVVLQQASRRKQHYLLACVCDGDTSCQVSGYFTERIVEWFHGWFLEAVLKNSCHREDVHRNLKKELVIIENELQEFCDRKGQNDVWQVWGILLWNDTFWIFQRGGVKGYLFNRRYNRAQRKPLQITEAEERDKIVLVQGCAQKKIGILLCTPEFGISLSEEEMIQVLFEETLKDHQIEKRLREIQMADEKYPKRGLGAVYIRLE